MKLKILLSMAILTICTQAVDNNTTKGLFLDSPVGKQKLSGKFAVSTHSTIKRFRYIDINTTLLPQIGSVNTTVNTQGTASAQTPISQEVLIPLNLFDGTQYMAKITKVRKSTATGTTIWSGTLVGMKHSHVSIASTNGVLAGSIRTEDGTFFKIVYSGNGTHMIQEINESNLPQEREPLVAPTSSSTSSASSVPSTASIDAGDVIDVMVVYTAAAKVAAGGQAAIESIINSSVSTMNTTFNNSNIATQVRLVHTAEVAYTLGETGVSTGFDTALNDLTNTTDGYMDEIHTLRDTYHADMVQLLFDNSSSGGLAWVMQTVSAGFDAYAFSVVHYNYADGWAFDHEFGHNMGMTHDRANSSSEGSYSYSYGYQSPTSAWHSVMSYACAGGCPRIDYWSNPAVTYSGESTGVAIGATDEADAHATITNNLSIIANWRVTPTPAPDLIVNSISLASTNLITGQNISLQASVLNQGDEIADSTTLRYFLSTDNTISTSDIALSTISVLSLAVGETAPYSVNVTAPLNAGTYYLGACVDAVNTELATANNCSDALPVTVALDTDGDGIADNVDTDDDNDGISDSDEIANGLNPLDASDAQADLDGDGFSNAMEIRLGTDIRQISSKPTWVPIFTGDGLLIIVPVVA